MLAVRAVRVVRAPAVVIIPSGLDRRDQPANKGGEQHELHPRRQVQERHRDQQGHWRGGEPGRLDASTKIYDAAFADGDSTVTGSARSEALFYYLYTKNDGGNVRLKGIDTIDMGADNTGRPDLDDAVQARRHDPCSSEGGTSSRTDRESTGCCSSDFRRRK
jgi:hypothetical protein